MWSPGERRELIAPPLRSQNREDLGLGRAMFACFLAKVVPVVQPKLLRGALGRLGSDTFLEVGRGRESNASLCGTLTLNASMADNVHAKQRCYC